MTTPIDLSEPLETALQRHFGYGAFQPGQRPVVESVLSGRPTVAIMPTGAGKSLCYQLPGLMRPGLTVVVSPLIALMKDQVEALQARGVAAEAINSHRSAAEQRVVLDRIRSGALKFLYVAPERLSVPGFSEQIAAAHGVALLAIDEAHCISRWGHDFRPDYRRIAEALPALKPDRVIACTATATPEVREDIVRSLQLRDAAVFVSGFLRTNLYIDVVRYEKVRDRERMLVALAQRYGAQPGAVIVYASSRKRVEAIGTLLSQHLARPVVSYHAGMAPEDRNEVQDRFMRGVADVAVATNAFGMGVDRGDVRAVIHADMPRTIEAYYQEIGRAGRDRAPSACALLAHASDFRVHEFLIGQSENPEFRDLELRKLRAMSGYTYQRACRHEQLLRYFGERTRVSCPGCDVCSPLRRPTDIPVLDDVAVAARRSRAPRPASAADLLLARKVLSGIARAGDGTTIRGVAAMLTGDPEADERLRGLSTHGLLPELGLAPASRIVRGLVEAGLAEPSHRGGIRLTDEGSAVMLGRAPLRAALDTGADSERGPKPLRPGGRPEPRRGAARARGGDGEEDAAEQDAVRDALLEWRRGRAGLAPAFVVMSNRTLDAVVAAMPEARAAFLAVPGLGPRKWDAWGEELVDVVGSARRAWASRARGGAEG